MKVLVAGGAGYIGAHACKALAKAGFEPVTVDNLSAGHAEAVRWGKLVRFDLSDHAALPGMIADEGVGAVMHFAASLNVGESVEISRVRPPGLRRGRGQGRIPLREVMGLCKGGSRGGEEGGGDGETDGTR